MPRQAIAYLTVIIVAAGGAVLLAATLLKVERSWYESLSKVKEKNLAQADSLIAQRRAAKELEAAVARANLGWDKTWDQVETAPNGQNGNLQVKLGSDAKGFVASAEAPLILHAFKPDAATGGYIYVGPFLARQENIRNADSTLVPGWPLLLGEKAIECATWQRGNWRFRTQIPSENKVRFESLTARFATNFQTLGQKRISIGKQDRLFKAAGEQLEQRNGELVGGNDPDAKVDPLRPELTKGLIEAIEGEEEARNLLETEIDAMRRAILAVQAENEGLETQIGNSRSSALDSKPARIGSRSK